MQTSSVVNFQQPARRSIAKSGQEYSFDTIYELCAFVSNEIRASKMKQKDLASKAGVCASTVSKIEYGITQSPRAHTLMAILQVLGFRIVVRR